ncbi:tripartite tricarboxylate transporter permease [Oscillibacter valericigenes]|uniref:tripartite tricarboxylate transporter permease n=1 Tax=Oscillibacter ruminantium TaxID=1263547 RepID=UPI0025AB09C5|nr:tripartite tricarboxylate transporter permease [Oscillibacter valericigenes]
MIWEGISSVLLSPSCLIWTFIGTTVGIIFGCIPGLTATMAIAMFLPVTYSMASTQGISVLIALYIGGISGGLISAILLNIPGTPASIATCLDGRPLALKGEAGKALGVGIVFSFLGTILSLLALVLISPPLAAIAIKFGPFEYFSITIFSLTLIITLSSKNIIKGLMTGVLGLIFATVGMAPIDSVQRYTFGSPALKSGFDILTVLVGVFAISEILLAAEASRTGSKKNIAATTDFKIKGFGFSFKEFKSQIGNLIRSSAIGIGLGILPGIGSGTSNMLSYSVARSQSKHPEKFGTGIIDGVVASESANNATIGGTVIPLLCLGIPGDSTAALLLGALIMKGVQPGPLIFQQNGQVVYAIYTAMAIASLFMLAVMFIGMKGFVRILKIPSHLLLPLVFVLCTVGAFGINNRLFDCFALIFFGFVGYLLQKGDYPMPPLILGFVLGNIMEMNLRRALSYSQGDISEFFTRPMSCVFLILAALSLVVSLYGIYKTRKKDKVAA